MRAGWILTVAAGAAISAAPADVAAQGRSTTRQEQLRVEQQREAERERLRIERDRERQREMRTSTTRNPVYVDPRRGADRDARRDDRDWDPRDIYNSDNGKNGKGPSFCRSGAGHPVHGREWCRDKGFGLGSSRDLFGDVIFRQPRDTRYNQQSVGRSILADILGSVVLGRFESYGRQYGSGPLTGYWLNDYGTRTLQLNVGSTPIARLVDTNRDGRVDDIVLRR